VFEEVVLKIAEVNVVVIGLPCQWSCRRTRGARVMTETHQGSRRGGGNAKVDAVRAVEDVEKGDDAIEADGAGTGG
jgi:hypothetical protein